MKSYYFEEEDVLCIIFNKQIKYSGSYINKGITIDYDEEKEITRLEIKNVSNLMKNKYKKRKIEWNKWNK